MREEEKAEGERNERGRREKKKEIINNKMCHVIFHVACHVGRTTVKRGFGLR